MKKETDRDPLDREFSPASLRGRGTRGKYIARIAAGSNVVRLAPEVAKAFPTEAAVNEALLSLVELSKRVTSKSTRPKRASGA